MNHLVDKKLITLFDHYFASDQLLMAKEIAIKIQYENKKNIEFLLKCLEMWVRLDLYQKALDTIQELSEAQYPNGACELCLQLVKFRMGKLQESEDFLYCAEILFANGKFVEGGEVLKKALERAPKNILIKGQLSKYFLDIGDLDSSILLSKDILQEDEGSYKYWSIYGNALRLRGFEEESYGAHLKALSINPDCYESLLDVTAINVRQAVTSIDFERSIKNSNRCLQVYLNENYSLSDLDSSLCKIKHDNEQAKYLLGNLSDNSLLNFINVSDRILYELARLESGFDLKLSEGEVDIINKYNKNFFISDQLQSFESCVNSRLDWTSIANQYCNSSPKMVVIDNFLNQETLNFLQKFCYESKVWHKTYQHAYLGAFVDKGFVSKVHLKISEELKIHLSDVIQQDRLEQLWAFKYDSILGKGINIHADFARINLNFWITPDEYHLNKNNGGLIVYTEPAPRDWNYFDYNINTEKIYEYLDRHNSSSVSVPYKANRAVLFDSTLFHETDEIKFEDSYLGRRVNMTYLFGTQLK